MMILQNIVPITLFSLSVVSMVLNLIARFSNGKFIYWKTFNIITLTTLLTTTICVFVWLAISRADTFSSLKLLENNLVNFSLVILASMYITFQEFLLFKNVMRWISSRCEPFDLKYSLLALFIPITVMILKMPFTTTSDTFPKDFWGALAYSYGFWHFMTAFSILGAALMVVIQLIQFIVQLHKYPFYLILVLIIYPLVMSSLFFLSMYAIAGIILLFILYFALQVMGKSTKDTN